MKPRLGVIAGGNWIVDHVKLVERWPSQDSLTRIFSQDQANGGAPYNILKDLSKLGATFPLEAVGLVGDDDFGRFIRADCQAHKIDTRQLRSTAQAATSYTDVMTVRDTGRRTFFHQTGANALLAPEDFDFKGTSARILHLGYLLLLDTLDQAGKTGEPRSIDVLRNALEHGLATSVDCVSDNSDRFTTVIGPALPWIDYIFVNDFEAEKLTGLTLGRGSTLSRSAVAAAAQALLALGVRRWVFLHFPEGACACSREGEVLWQPAVRVPPDQIRGTAGAGDAFAAGMLFGLHENWPVSRGLELAVAAAASSLNHPSCSESIRPVAECLVLSHRWGYQSLPDGA